MAKKRKFFKRLIIVPVAFAVFSPIYGMADENQKPLKMLQTPKTSEGYTINFNNVSMLELLKFISKISNTNFVYDPQDLQFTVTFTSEQPTSLENIMTAFTQILRIHGLSLMEEANNIVIHKNPNVRQITNIVNTTKELSSLENNYLITRVFHIFNSNPKNIESILLPMLSESAIIKTSLDTRQIVLMDLATNVAKAAELINYLDMPASNLEMRPYKFQNASAEGCSMLLNQLIMPLSEGNPVILVPQAETNTLFIVSTPYLIQKSIEILLQLDQMNQSKEKTLSLDKILIYKIKNKSFVTIQKGLKEILEAAHAQGYLSDPLSETIASCRFISPTNSILFIGNKTVLDKLSPLLTVLDEAPETKSAEVNKFFIFEPKNKSADQLFKYLKEIQKHLISSHLADPNLINTLENVKVIPSSNTLVFTGSNQSIEEITALLKTADLPVSSSPSDFLIYTPIYVSPQTLIDSMKQVARKFSSSGLTDTYFIKALEEAKFIPSSYAIVFTGSLDTIGKIKKLMDELDTVSKRSQLEDNMLIYKLKFLSKKGLDQALESYAETLPIDSPIQETIEQRSFLAQSNSFVFKGTQTNLDRLKEILDLTDTSTNSKEQLLMYRIKNSNESLVLENLKNYTSDLSSHDAIYDSLTKYKYNPTSHLLIFKGSQDILKAIESLMASLDQITPESLETLNYKVISENFKLVLDNLKKVQDRMNKTDPLYQVLKSAQVIESSHLMILKGDESTLKSLKDLLSKVDSNDPVVLENLPTQQIYNLKYSTGKTMMKNLEIIRHKLEKDPNFSQADLLETLKNIELVKATNSLIITGPKKDVNQVITYIQQFDISDQENKNVEQILNYKIKNSNPDAVVEKLKAYVENLQSSEPTYEPLKNAKYVPSSKLIIFKGTQTDLNAITALMGNFDPASELTGEEAPTHYVYSLKNASGDVVIKYLETLKSKIKRDKNNLDPILIQTLSDVEWVPQNQTLYIAGPKKYVDQVLGYISTIDVPGQEKTSLVIKLNHIAGEEAIKKLKVLVKNSKDPNIDSSSLDKIVQNIEWIQNSNSLFISGKKVDVDILQSMLQGIDVPLNTDFILYKPTKISVKALKKNLENLSFDFQKSGLTDQLLIKSITSARINDSNNALIFSGNAETLKKVQNLLETVDVPQAEGEMNKSHFLFFKATNSPIHQVQESLLAIALDLEKSGLTDPQLIQTIRSSKIVDKTNSITFTGDEGTLAKVKELATSIDNAKSPDGIEHIGQTTFMIYKIKAASHQQLMESLRAIGSDLVKSKGGDQDLIKSINNMRYVSETNSLVFTGPTSTMNKINTILEKFDTLSNAPIAIVERIEASDYALYQPKHINGDELIKLIQDFEASLSSTGIKDPRLIDSISNLKWMPRTSNIIVTGDKPTVDKVITLLEKFDNSSKAFGEKKPDTSIETIDESSFLIYKVQYHNGASILEAVQGIGSDLRSNTATTTQALVQSINSLRFIKVTNSLIATGDPKTLVRLKELIQSVDVPLKQVFIEVLVIETDLTSILQFGLRWAGQGNYKNRLALAAGNVPPTDNSGSVPSIPFISQVQAVNAKTPPNAQNIPIPTGGSLGVIGDLIFHKGKSYLSLGDFINAIQTDNDSTIVLNQKIITQDNRDTTLFVGQNIPYNGSVVTNSSQNTTISSNIEYMDVGIKLDITPKVGEEDIITLDISQDISEQVNAAANGGQSASTIYGIQTRRTSISTSVHVPNEHFVVLTGQIRNSAVRNKSAIPCLGGLPLIGAAFSDNITNKESSTIVMFIKPHIVNTYEEYKRLTEKQEDLFRSQGVDEDFDSGLEMVKSPDDK